MGIGLAASRISRPARVTAAKGNERVEVGAVAARAMDRAEEFATANDVPVS